MTLTFTERAVKPFFRHLALTLMLIGPASATSAQQMIAVETPEELSSALVAPQPGLTIAIAAGNYGALVLKDVTGEGDAPITLRSADPANPATFSGLLVRSSSHLVLEGLTFDYTFAPEDDPNLRPFQVVDSADVRLRDNLFDGDVAVVPEEGAAGEAGYPTAYGLTLRGVTGGVVEGNEIRTFYRGLVASESSGLEIVNNDLHSLRMDGMNFAQVQAVRIEGNHIHDFKRAVESADHADFIQFWTARTKTPSQDILIRNNILNSESGWFTQSIFMRNERVDTGEAGAEMFYRNVTIEGNLIINAHLHGITVGETAGLVIRNNSLIRNARSEGKENNPGLWTPQIRVAPTSTDVVIKRNATNTISGYETQPDWTVEGNLQIQDRFPAQPGFYDRVFVAARSGDPSNLASFAALEGGPLDGTGIGSALLSMNQDAPPQSLQPSVVIRVLANTTLTNKIAFQARPSDLPEGVVFAEAGIEWDMGDGNKANGVEVEHLYAETGPYLVKLNVTLPDGTVLEAQTEITIQGPKVLDFDPARGVFTSFAQRDPVEVPQLDIGSGPAIVGQGVAPIIIAPAMIAPFFDAKDFRLDMRLRAAGNYKSAGELLRIHKTLLINVTARGSLDIQFSTFPAEMLKLTTPPIAFFGENWVDVSLSYSSATELFSVMVNGRLISQGSTFGDIRPLEFWGLSLGNPFANRKSFDGEVASLTLWANEETFSLQD